VELPGRLTVVSEPPELEVFLDGSAIGRTPIWLREVKPGAHTLRIGQEKTEVHVQPGKKMALSFFKDSFIDITKEEEAVEAPVPEVKKPREKEGVARPPRPEEREDIIRFEQFINRIFDFFRNPTSSSPHSLIVRCSTPWLSSGAEQLLSTVRPQKE
jgi:hypothetical protein